MNALTDAPGSTDRHKQRLSELEDNELAPAYLPRLLDALLEDAELRTTWEHYHLIGHIIRGESLDPAFRALAGRVRTALVTEPLRIASRRRVFRTWRDGLPLAGMALAASVALLAVVAAPALVREATISGAVSVTSQPLASHVPRFPHTDERWRLDRPDLASKLDRFLVTHQETAPATGAKGMLHYATFVGYENPR